MRTKARQFVYAAAALLMASWGQDAHAYLDPGTGSMILQAIIGAIAMGYFVIRLWWTKLKTFCLTLLGRRPAANVQGDEAEAPRDSDGDR